MSAQAAMEGLARCVKGLDSIGPVVQVHARRKPPSSVEPSVVVALDDAAASWQGPGHKTYSLGMRLAIYVPAVKMEAAQEILVKLIDEIAAFRQTQQGQSLDATDGVLSTVWGPLILEDLKVDNQAMVQASMNVVAEIQQ